MHDSHAVVDTRLEQPAECRLLHVVEGDNAGPREDHGGDRQGGEGADSRTAEAESPDRVVARIAAGQHGLVTRDQLVGARLGRGAIAHRVLRGRLHHMHRGVYLVGHPVAPPLAHELAGVLTCGAGAVLSHLSAARCWALLKHADGSAEREVDVTVAARRPLKRPGVRIHYMARLDPCDVTAREGIPITTPARTLLDLAATVEGRELERALAEAEVRRLVSPQQLAHLLAAASGRRGAAALKAVLRNQAGPSLTRSKAEERVLALVRAARLPVPQTNTRVGRHEVDLYWRDEHLALEVDGYAFHSSRTAFERDRLRDAELQAAGLRVMRVTWRQIVDAPEAVVARLAQALAQPRER